MGYFEAILPGYHGGNIRLHLLPEKTVTSCIFKEDALQKVQFVTGKQSYAAEIFAALDHLVKAQYIEVTVAHQRLNPIDPFEG